MVTTRMVWLEGRKAGRGQWWPLLVLLSPPRVLSWDGLAKGVRSAEMGSPEGSPAPSTRLWCVSKWLRPPPPEGGSVPPPLLGAQWIPSDVLCESLAVLLEVTRVCVGGPPESRGPPVSWLLADFISDLSPSSPQLQVRIFSPSPPPGARFH